MSPSTAHRLKCICAFVQQQQRMLSLQHAELKFSYRQMKVSKINILTNLVLTYFTTFYNWCSHCLFAENDRAELCLVCCILYR